MEAKKHIVVLLVLILLISVTAQSANKPAEAELSDTHVASCLVKITFDPLVLPLDDITIDYLLHSSGIGGKVAREVLNISPDQVSDIFKVEALAGSSGPSWLGRAETGSILTEDRRQKTEGRGQLKFLKTISLDSINGSSSQSRKSPVPKTTCVKSRKLSGKFHAPASLTVTAFSPIFTACVKTFRLLR